MRSSAPGAKFSTNTSQRLIRLSSTCKPSGVLVLSVTARLLWFSMVKYRLSTPGMSRSCLRVASPSPTRSILITSAPIQASNWVQLGPDCTWVKSIILIPSNALLMKILLESIHLYSSFLGFFRPESQRRRSGRVISRPCYDGGVARCSASARRWRNARSSLKRAVSSRMMAMIDAGLPSSPGSRATVKAMEIVPPSRVRAGT